jgi:hypothetical protein
MRSANANLLHTPRHGTQALPEPRDASPANAAAEESFLDTIDQFLRAPLPTQRQMSGQQWSTYFRNMQSFMKYSFNSGQYARLDALCLKMENAMDSFARVPPPSLRREEMTTLFNSTLEGRKHKAGMDMRAFDAAVSAAFQRMCSVADQAAAHARPPRPPRPSRPR